MTAFWITISILIPLIISSVFIALLYFRHKKYKAFIVEHSKAVRNLTALNQSYRFHTIEAIKLRFDYDNENLFEKYPVKTTSPIISEITKEKSNV